MTTVTTSGIWTGVSHPLSQLQGLNTKHVSWGVPDGPQQSGYLFEGVSAVAVPLDGSEFKLGTFTHINKPLQELGAERFTVSLKLTLSFDQGGPNQEFSFVFAHNETPNRGDYADDEVTLPALPSEDTITLGGSEYALHLTGFRQDGKVVSKFDSPEDRSNSADIIARLVPAPVKQPVPAATVPQPAVQPPVATPAMPEQPCHVKSVVDTGTLFGLTLERLNRRSVVHLLEQLIEAFNAHCEKLAEPPGGGVSMVDLDKLRSDMLIAINDLRQSSQAYSNEASNLKQEINNLVVRLPQTIHQTIHNVNIEHVTQQIEVLNDRLIIIQKAAQRLDEEELNQVQLLLMNLLRTIDFGSVVQNISISVGGRSFDLHRLLEILATADRVSSIQIQYSDLDPWEIAGARFVMADQTQVFFTARILPDATGLRLIYLFETHDWKGLPAQFRLVFIARKTSYAVCGKKFNVDSFDGVEHTNIVFDLCSRG